MIWPSHSARSSTHRWTWQIDSNPPSYGPRPVDRKMPEKKNQRSRLTMQQKMIGRPGNGQKKRPNQNKSTVRPKPQTNAQGNQQLQDSTRWQRKMNARPRTGPSLFHFSLLRLLSDSLASTQVADLQLSYGRYIPTRHLLGRLRNLPRSPKSIAPLD